MPKYLIAATLTFAVVLGACSSDDSSSSARSESVAEGTTTETGNAASTASEVSTSAPVDAPGGITLTIGDETWEFGGALCAYQNAKPGDPESEWNVSFKQDNLQVYVNNDSFGPSVSITDVVNFGTSEWVAEGDAIELTVDGNEITAEGTFTDKAGGGLEREGTLTAECPSWVGG